MATIPPRTNKERKAIMANLPKHRCRKIKYEALPDDLRAHLDKQGFDPEELTCYAVEWLAIFGSVVMTSYGAVWKARERGCFRNQRGQVAWFESNKMGEVVQQHHYAEKKGIIHEFYAN